MQELGERVGLEQSSCSRNVAALGKIHRKGMAGYGLVDAVEDPLERRRKIMFLTPKGRDRINKVLKALHPEVEAFTLDRTTAADHINRVMKDVAGA